MQTAVIFIDAGYLFSAGSDLLVSRAVPRSQLELVDPAGLIDNIFATAQGIWDGDPLRLLRAYWYDGAYNGVPSPSQITVGDLPRVKLRLGRISAGGQKGVDGLIILDLITVAHNRAADVAIVVSGDEDLRETALHAQSFGLTVVVAGFPPTGRQRQSELLLREADHVVSLGEADIRDHILVEVGESEDADTSEAPVAPNATLSGPPVAEAEESLQALCRGVVTDPRFAGESVVELDDARPRLSYRADRVLIARLSELTGSFPVDNAVVRRARDICIELVRGDG